MQTPRPIKFPHIKPFTTRYPAFTLDFYTDENFTDIWEKNASVKEFAVLLRNFSNEICRFDKKILVMKSVVLLRKF